jgi:hypothetical protein
VSHDFNSAETFLNRRWQQFRGHLVQRVILNQACTRRVTRLANVKRNIEEQSFDFASVLPRENDEWTPVATGETGSVYVRYGPLQLDALL